MIKQIEILIIVVMIIIALTSFFLFRHKKPEFIIHGNTIEGNIDSKGIIIISDDIYDCKIENNTIEIDPDVDSDTFSIKL